MFWWAIILAPLGAAIPGPIGAIFRSIQAVVMWGCLLILVLLVWSGAWIYNGAKCMLGNEYNCEMTHQVVEIGKIPLNFVKIFTDPNPEWDAKRAKELAKLDIESAQRERDAVDRYRARNGLPALPQSTAPVAPKPQIARPATQLAPAPAWAAYDAQANVNKSIDDLTKKMEESHLKLQDALNKM